MPQPPELYDRRYFLSNYCEGWQEFRANRGLSAIKLRQLHLLDVSPGMRVLDAGCGRGEVLLACARAGAYVSGIDYSVAAVEISQETLAGVENAEVIQGSVEHLPWADAHFDRILFADVIEHLNIDVGHRALCELRRVLAPRGVLLVHTSPNRLFRTITWPLARRVLRLTGFAPDADALEHWLAEAERYHVNEQTPRSLRRALRRAGFPNPRIWVDSDVTRGGKHHLTQGFAHSRIARFAGWAARLRLFGLLLSNDLYAMAGRDR